MPGPGIRSDDPRTRGRHPVILTTTQTPTPVPTATPAATAVPTIATVKPTQQQTSKSPAPVFGIIAGLGAAAVLLRLRR